MNFYDYKTVSYARPQKALPTNDPMDFSDYKTVSYARPQAGGTTSSSSGSIWGDLGNIAGKYESALGEAEAILGPQYQRAREQTMSEVDRNMVSRGFYGQAPGDAIRASTLTDLDMAYQAALGNYATNIMDRRAQMELQKYMFDKEMREQRQQSKDRKKSSIWTGLGLALGGFLGGPAGAPIGTAVGNILSSIFS